MASEDITDYSRDPEFQVIDGTQVFHEYTIVNGRILKVTAWWPASQAPWVPGMYQGLVKAARGEKVIKYFNWDGAAWRSDKTGKFTTTPFEWRGMSSPPEDQF